MRLNIEEQVSKELFAKMVEVARQLRRDSTPTEEALWKAMRSRRLGGAKFRRQQPIGPFVADFSYHHERLLVEVDGPIHRFQKAVDLERDQLLAAAGFRVLRIPSEDVEDSLPIVLERIWHALKTNSPSPLGEG